MGNFLMCHFSWNFRKLIMQDGYEYQKPSEHKVENGEGAFVFVLACVIVLVVLGLAFFAGYHFAKLNSIGV